MKFKKIFTLSVSLLIAGFSIASCGNENVPLEQTLNIVEESKILYEGSVFNIELETKNLSDEIAYISSDETIATVDSDGKVTAINVGEVIITVKSGDLSDSIKITVKERIHVDKFTLSLTAEYIQVGESLLLEYEIEPNEYSSEVYFEAIKGEDLVEISGNRVKALSSGEVTIVARCANATSNMVNFSIYDFTAVVADHEIYVGDYFAVGTSLDDGEVTEDNLTIEYEHESYLRFEEAKYGMLYFTALSMGETSFVIKLNDGRVSCPVEVTILGYNDYIGVDKDEFYENYTRATDPFDARCRTECNLMSGDISPQDQEPTIAIDQPRNGDKLYKNVFHNFDYGEQAYNVMKSDGSFAFTIYTMAHSLMVPLSTRNTVQRGGLSVFNQISTIMISGIVVALVFPMAIMPIIGVDKTSWIILMGILSGIALPLTLIEYYFTKERITEEKSGEKEKKVPFLLQLKAIFTDKCVFLLIIYFLIYTIGTTFKNIALVYYCNYVLGTYNDGITQTLVSVLGGIPMGIGIFAVWPLAKKFGKKNVTMIGFLIYAIGSAICWMQPNNLILVLIGQFIKNIGGLPSAYVFMALMADCLDNLEWKTGFRSDGVVTATYNIVQTTIVGVGTGLFNLGLSSNGYVAPVTGEVPSDITNTVQKVITNSDGSVSTIFNQNENVVSFIVFAFLGFEVITGLIAAILIYFIDVEKTIDNKQKILVQREKEKFAKEGKEWLPADERARLDQEKEDEEAEIVYKEELLEKCQKQGKDFAKEYAIHLYKKELKAKKAKEKDEITIQKEIAFKEKMAKKKQLKFDKMSDKQKQRYEKHLEKTNQKWLKEKQHGQEIYDKFQKELGNI